MSALPSPEAFKVGRAISREEWAELRRQSLYGLPPELVELPLDQILLPYQQRSIRARLLSRVTVIEKSRRTGLTWAFAADAALTAASTAKAGGMDVFYVGYNLEMAREFIDVCGMWAKLFSKAAFSVGEFLFEDFNPATGETRKIQAFRISFASGFEVVALPSSARSLRGKQGLVILDEAAFHDDLDEMIKAAMALRIWGGRLVVISTHNGQKNPFNRLVEDIRAGAKTFALIRIDFDDALRDGLYRRICQRTGEDWSPETEALWRSEIIDDYGDGADEELFCIPSEGSGVWLLPAVVEACATSDCPVLRWDMPTAFTAEPEAARKAAADQWYDQNVRPHLGRLDATLVSYFGQDFGRVADLSVIWPVQIGAGLRRRTPFVIELRNIPFQQQQQILFRLIRDLPRFGGGAMDAGGNGAALAEAAAQAFGFERVAQILFTVEWYRDNMPKLKATLEAIGMDVPADPWVREDFLLVRMIDGVARLPKTRTTQKGDGAAEGKKKRRHGDSVIAAALAHFASLQAPAVYRGYQPVPVATGRPGRLFEGAGDGLLPDFRGGL